MNALLPRPQAAHPEFPQYSKVDEIPFDFLRRMMSVVVKTPDGIHRLICKGAPEEVYKHCVSFHLDGELFPMDHMIPVDLKEEFDELSADGFRVLALAYRDLAPKPAYSKESADVILLEKDLMVLKEGVLEGRKVFANILKYIRMGASSNFGNMFSVLGASVFLPFVPMIPIQILTNNLLYDFSQVPIPADDVDPEQIARPRPWSMNAISRFILLIGPCSSIFDYTTFFVMLSLFDCWDPAKASLFQTGWFVESLLTQTLIIHVIRTNRIPFLQSRASWPLIVTTTIIMGVGVWLPSSPIAETLGFTPLPALYWPVLAATLTAYLLLTQAAKTWLFRKGWVTE